MYANHVHTPRTGVLVFHDSWMPSVRAAADFAVTNLGYHLISAPEIAPHPFEEDNVSMTIMVKPSYKIWEWPWDHFVPFGAAAMGLQQVGNGRTGVKASAAQKAPSASILLFFIVALAAQFGAVAALLLWRKGTVAERAT